MAEAILFCGILAYVSFRHWLHHDRRRMIHRERLIAIEKGVELPMLEQEVKKRTFNVERFLLLAGWSWIFVGIGLALALHFMAANPSPEWANNVPPRGAEFAAIIPFGIGIAHLITYKSGERRTVKDMGEL